MTKVLIVDDEPLVRRSLERALSKRGYEVLVAADGTEGLATWRRELPAVIFLDVLMPGLSGPQVLAQMGAEKKAIVVLMSAYTGEYNWQTAKEIGADLFVPKPFDNIFTTLDQVEELIK
jgi:CheY-like chemotaxis protein